MRKYIDFGLRREKPCKAGVPKMQEVQGKNQNKEWGSVYAEESTDCQ